MLEERITFPQRVGSARSGSGSSRVSSARVAAGRIGSARPSDTRRPKLHTGRPSSAPPAHNPPATPSQGWLVGRLAAHGPHRIHDVAHLNLRVEGKSIRSVSYTPRRQQPVSRGSVRVVSSHAHPIPARHRQFLSMHKAGGCERRGEAAAVAAAAAAAHSKGAMRAAAAAAVGFGSTYTVVCLDPEQDGGSHLGATFTKEEAPAFFGEGLGATYTLRSGQGLPPHSPSSSDSDLRVLGRGEYEYDVPPPAPGGRGGYWEAGGGREDLSRVATGDTTSNEDSESTVMSLGHRIQLMATGPAGTPASAPASTPAWDAEWRTLLQQNHRLLLQLSSREDLRGEEQHPDTPRSAPVQDSAVQTLPPEPPLLSESEAGEEPLPLDGEAAPSRHSPECVLEDIVEESSLSDRSSPCTTTILDCLGKATSPLPCRDRDSPPCPTKQALDHPSSPALSHGRTSPSVDGEESVHFLCKSPALPQDSFQGPLSASPLPQETPHHPRQSPSSVGEDTEYLQQLSPPPDRLQGTGEKWPLLGEGLPHSLHCASPVLEQIPEIPKQIPEAEDTDQQNRPSLSPAYPTKHSSSSGDQDTTTHTPGLHTRPSYTDSSCMADLPSYRAGAVTTFIMRSRFSARDKPALPHPQPSKDLLEALKMIEDEEKNAKSITEPPERDLQSSSEKTVASSAVPSGISHPTGGEREGTASLPVLQVLAEKVFLFTQDLVERWNLVEHNGSREELLRQIAEAERQLEALCVAEGWKRDPSTSPDLHRGCEEQMQRQQAEADGRIQKNLELIRKLMDDKRRLTGECERLDQRSKLSDKQHANRVKAAEERHSQELRSLKERLIISEQERREKWTAQKTRAIRESTHRSLETKLKDMGAKHRDEVSLLKAQHWEALREAEERHRASLQAQEEELKRKFEEEKEEACRRERDREQQRLDLELRQSEQLSLGRLEAVRRQQEKDLKALIEEHQAALDKTRQEAEAGAREAARERDRMREEWEDKLRSCTRKYEEELTSLQEREERVRKEWREQFAKQETEARQQAERELRERLKRQRDKEIDRAIRELQAETAAREEDQRRTCDAKMKNLRERYEAEMQEVECGERAARTRYLEMKSLLTQKEEEIVYLRARLHTQDLELCDLQQMLQPPDG
ncbi:centrosomal protein of 131 kDa-like isoform X2 [Scylla paramamosain]|uniref:centrosomal protein of 131 kDa-like isoform X2 n=1 Tax=Scylla paramamosain TaxID=85552 RepID=UPI0030829A7A